MKSKLLLLTVCFLALFAVPVEAQDDGYRLRVPSAEEYLLRVAQTWSRGAVLPRILGEEILGMDLPEQLIQLLETIYLYRYGDSASTMELVEAYEVLNQGDRVPGNYYLSFLDVQQWNLRIVKNWLEDNPIDLLADDEIEFGPYTLSVMTGQTQAGILIHISRDDFQDYWFARPEGDGYQLIPGPVLHYEAGYMTVDGNGLASYVFVQDVTGDGMIEIISKERSIFPGWSYSGTRSTFTVYGWQNQEWVTLVSSQSVTNEVKSDDDPPQWQFVNIDSDTPLELIENDFGQDNFYCVQHRQQIFDWNGSTYEVTSDVTTFQETVGCALRFAQQAMWAHDYDRAIDDYNLALTRTVGDVTHYSTQDRQHDLDQLVAYAQERLFIAYMLAGDVDAARDLLPDLREQPHIEHTIAQQLVAIPEDKLDALAVCQAAYNFIESLSDDELYRNLPNMSYLEETVHIYYDWGSRPGQPQNVGCDLPYMQQQIAAMTATPTPTATRQPAQPTATPDAITMAEQQMEWDLWQAIRDMGDAARDGEMDTVLSASEAVLDSPLVTSTSDFAFLARHYRAFALEALGHPDEALAEYVAIYEAAPKSAWGRLAALHIVHE